MRLREEKRREEKEIRSLTMKDITIEASESIVCEV
jgi:hypothetical protein